MAAVQVLESLEALGLPDLRCLCDQQVALLTAALAARFPEASVSTANKPTETLSRSALRAKMPQLFAFLPRDVTARCLLYIYSI